MGETLAQSGTPLQGGVSLTYDILGYLWGNLKIESYHSDFPSYSNQLLDILKTEPPALILLSPSQQSDRYQFCQALRSADAIRLIPVLFVCGTQDDAFNLTKSEEASALKAEVSLTKAFYVGGTDYLSYPLRREERNI